MWNSAKVTILQQKSPEKVILRENQTFEKKVVILENYNKQFNSFKVDFRTKM